MTTLNYKSLVTKEVSPSIVKMGFRLTSQNADVDKAIKDLAELRRKCKAEILKTHSVDNSSYRQENIEVQPFYTMVTKKKKVGGETEEYVERKLDSYIARSDIRFVLENEADTTIDDFVKILNMTLDLKTKCYYDFCITDSERDQIMIELTAEAVDKALQDMKTIIEKSSSLAETKPIIISIDDNGPSRNVVFDSAPKYKGAPQEEAEAIITPELVNDIFINKKIKISKELTIKFELISQKTI